MFRAFAFVLALAAHASVAAAPSVFLRTEAGRAWWNVLNAESRVIGTSAGLVTAAKLSKFIADTEAFNSYKVCALSAVVADTYVGVDKAIQDEINATLKHVSWRVDARTPNGIPVVAQSVLYEACDDTDNRGAAVLVADAHTSDIMLFVPMGSFEPTRGVRKPILTAFLSKPEQGAVDAPLFTFSSCTECGAATAVYYDVTRRKLYTEYNNH